MREVETFLNQLRREGSVREREMSVLRQSVQPFGVPAISRYTKRELGAMDRAQLDAVQRELMREALLDDQRMLDAIRQRYEAQVMATLMPSGVFAPGAVIGGVSIAADPALNDPSPSMLPPHYAQALSGDFDEDEARTRHREVDDAREPHCATCGRLVPSWGPLLPDHDRHCKTCDLDFQYEATSYGDQEGDEVAWQERYGAARQRRLALRRMEVANAD